MFVDTNDDRLPFVRYPGILSLIYDLWSLSVHVEDAKSLYVNPSVREI